MKAYCIILPLGVALALSSACSKPDQTEAPSPVQVQQPPENPVAQTEKAAGTIQQGSAEAQAAAQKAATELQAQTIAAQNTAEQVATDASAQAAAVSSKVHSIIETARKLMIEKKWSEALGSLSELAGLKLTPDQQAAVDAIKQETQKLMQEAAANRATEEATKAVSDLFKKK